MKKKIIISLLALSAISPMSAKDIRSKVKLDLANTQVNVIDPDNNTQVNVIDPDKHAFGLAFGSSEEKVISELGNPNGYLQLGVNKTAMIYGKTTAFIFSQDKLCGVNISHRIIDHSLSGEMPEHKRFNYRSKWKLSNGIEQGMLKEIVEKITKNQAQKNNYEYSYNTEKAVVELRFSHHRDQDGNSSRKVYGVYIKRGSCKIDN